MTGDRIPASASAAVGFSLIPSELLHEIFCRLALPDLHRIRSISKTLSSLVSGDDFRRLYELRSNSGDGWLYVYKKRPPRGSVLRGFNDRSGRWFNFPIAGLISSAVPPGEDLYFLAASGDFFLFASNGLRELIAVNLTARTVRKIPTSPLGPRGTSSWRRSGLKLLSDRSGSDSFRFVFAELYEDRPVLFEYCSETDEWRSSEAQFNDGQPTAVEKEERICLNVVQFSTESVVLCAGRNGDEAPVFFRPRFREGGSGADRLHVYGDGNMAVVKSVAVEGDRIRARMLTGVEVWGMSSDGREWELVARVPDELIEGNKKPYGVMMGCLEERGGIVRVVLMSNCKGSWDLIWLCYDRIRGKWEWVPVPDCGTKGLNMAGIAISSSLIGFGPSL